MVDQLSDETTTHSAGELVVRSTVCTSSPLENKDYLQQKYSVEGMSARQIALLLGCSHSTVNDAINHFRIEKRKVHAGHIPFGFRLRNGKVVAHVREQATLAKIELRKQKGWTNSKISDWLNSSGISAPKGTIWYPATVGRIRKWLQKPAKKAR